MTARRPRPRRGRRSLFVERRVEESEPTREVRLHGQLALEDVLETKLLGVVALLFLSGGNEGPERPWLVAVDEVHGPVSVAKGEHRRQELTAEAAVRELRADEVRRRDEVLEVPVADDEPLVAESVRTPAHLRAGLLRSDPEQLVELALGAHEVARRERLEHHGCDARRLQAGLGLERDRRCREREELFEI